ncbi:MAG TPA: efflux RND transporter permease subunit [Steroidobacteraceae bacterium]|nr:efflux RND transporter permease subunit [Steroidobacteraceae bacterium]
MNISAPFITRPVATSLLASAILMVGIVAYLYLPVSAVPEIDFPTLSVGASLPGANPETMASNVATPLERQFSLIPGVTEMTSTSAVGSTSITLQFELSRSLDGAAEDVQAAINAAGGQLPTNLPAPPTIRKVNPADAPVLIINLTSATLPLTVLTDYADSFLAQQLSRIDGVGQVGIGGSVKPAVRIQLDPRKIAQLGLNIDDIRTQIAANTVNSPKGVVTGALRNYTVYANDQVLDAASWNQLIVGYSHGAPVRIRDIGQAIAGPENDQSGAWTFPGAAFPQSEGYEAGQCVQLMVSKQPGANVIDTVERVKAALPQLERNMPPAARLWIVADRTQTIRASVSDVEMTLGITVLLVVAVIFLFLRNVRATIIPSTILPLSLLAAVAVVYPLGYSLDNLSLMALAIAAGFVVDDAIVMLDVIWRRMEHGQKPLQAALDGARDVGFTILSISISLIAVFTPVMFMGGVVGRLMREFAVTLSAAVLVSLLLSLTLTPMLCGQFLRAPQPAKSWLMRALESGFERLERSYAHALDWVMLHKRLTLAVFICTALATVAIYRVVPTGFFPQQDTAFLDGAVQTSDDSSYEKTVQKIEQVGRIIAADPDVTEDHLVLGSSSPNQANLNVGLKIRGEGRSITADQVIARLRPKLAQVVGATTVMKSKQDITIGARNAKAQYQYTLSDPDLDELDTWAPKLYEAMRALPGLVDVSTDQETNGAAIKLQIDRDVAGRFGITPSAIDAAIYDQLGQHQVAQYFTQLNAYHVVVEATPSLQSSAQIFNSIYIKSPLTGKLVPLSLFVKVDPNAHGPLVVSHQGQLPAVTLSFNLKPGVALGAATAEIARMRLDIGAPATLVGSFQGTAQAFQQSLKDEPVLILAALLSVYVILGVLYESYIHPLTILSTLPSAGLGALLALIIAGDNLNVIGIIGLILLIGIVKKNGIMIVDVALQLEREHDIGPEEAAVRASKQRLRPILMTTCCAFFSGIPLILSQGAGSEFRQPLGIAIVGGLIVSQALTLFTTPVIYVYLDRLSRRFSGQPARAQTFGMSSLLVPNPTPRESGS